MNKQEVIDEIENAIPDFLLNDFQRGKEAGLTYALELVGELDEPEKPVVPQFVAEWIKSQKESFSDASAIDMYDNLTLDNKGGYYHEVWLWVIYHHYDFIKAWHDDYTVEQEKLYTVEIEGVSSSKLFKNIQASEYLFHSGNGFEWYTDRLTEQEIKEADERLWQFAKEVEE